VERSVVVGVKGVERSAGAVRWAALEADRRRLPLKLVHVRPRPAPHSHRWDHEVDERGLRRLDVAAEAARSAAPGVRVETELVKGRPVPVLVRESREAGLVVLGARTPDDAGYRWSGAVATAVVARAACPVVVHREPEAPDGPVVVGVDGSGANEAAVEHAFEVADALGAPLLAVLAVTDPLVDGAGHRPRLTRDWSAVVAEQRRLLTGLLAVWRDKRPDVPVESVVLRDSPVQALVRTARRARLLVVGTHGHAPLTGRLLGSTSQALALHAPCPLVVVPRG
jgi:nucleotide-binding universal stress UspA family protein